ncbi:hypothetical protein RAA17_15920 [Komagataeibacter rhaeticus]|nr:hypothetical protein [Komagataeibacter rhaeticus]
MGASPAITMRRVILPLTMPGIQSGCVLVFILSVSAYVTPMLIGGMRVKTMPMTVVNTLIDAFQWPFGAAQALVLSAIGALIVLVFFRLTPCAGAVDEYAAIAAGPVLRRLFFLLAPILVVVLASFNAGAFLTFPPQGLSLRWYRTFFHNAVFLRAFIESMEIAVAATSISAVIGTMAALFSMRTTPALANIVRLGMTLPLVLPEVLTAIGLLFFFYAMGIGVHYSVALLVGHDC